MRVPIWIMTLPLVASATSAGAQKPGRIHLSVQAEVEKVFVVSCIRGGNIFYSSEMRIKSHDVSQWCQLDGSDQLPPGAYDVRVEGEGFVTEFKRGIVVTSGNRMNVSFDAKPGKGVHIVEYATGAVSREEVAMRLTALETAVTKLTAAVEALKKPK